MTGLIDPSGRAIPSGSGARVRARALNERRSHEGASDKGTFLRPWRPQLRSADGDWLGGDRDMAVARARDIGRNEGIGASATARRLNSAVGFKWRLSSKISARALGITPAQAHELRRQIESRFRPYAYGPTFSADAERKKTFGQILRCSAAHIYQDGEALGLIEWAADEDTRFKTRWRVVDPDRLSNPNGLPETPLLRGGVERNRAMAPVRYHIRESHPNDLGAFNSLKWTAWERYATNRGRPQVLHAFDELRAGQSRGVTRFVSVLKLFKAVGKFTDNTVEAAALNALFLGFIKSNAGPSAVGEYLSAEEAQEFAAVREDHYKQNPVDLDGVQMTVLGPDDEAQLQTTSRDTTGFESFFRAILRLIAAALGLTYEELTMDFSQTNYSSARAAFAVAWQETLAFRGLIKCQLADPFFMAWLEEAIDIGEVVLPDGAPDFYEAIDAYVECDWIGPGRGYIDPTKEIDAAAARIEAGISTLERECADQGDDWEEVAEQTAFERQTYADLGIPYPADGALARVSAIARSPEHSAALDTPVTA